MWSYLGLDDPAHLTMAPEPPSSKIEPSKVSISSQEAPVKIYDYVLVSKIKFSTRTLRGIAAQKYALQFNFILKF